MAQVLTDSTNYTNIANAIRSKNGETTEYYPSEMATAINNISIPDTLVAANGDVAALRQTDVAYTALTATANDIRAGTTAITEEGTIVGKKNIPAYETTGGIKYVPAGSTFEFKLETNNLYDYTKLQVIICAYNSSMSDSVSAEKISINDNVYNVGSTTSIATVTKDSVNKSINLGITNTGSTACVIRYFTYKEES